jgi:hypothetical protein
MAAMMGVSSRTVGRWLREGRAEGVRKIPREYASLVNFVYRWHKEESEARASRDDLPTRDSDARGIAYDICSELGINYYDDAIAYAQRKPLPEMRRVKHSDGSVEWVKTGQTKVDPDTNLVVLGNRVFIENAQFLSRELRLNVTAGLVARGEFIGGSISSDVSLAIYFYETLGKYAAMHQRVAAAKGSRISVKQAEQMALNSFIQQFGVDPREIDLQTDVSTISTKSGAYTFNIDAFGTSEIARQIEKQDAFYRERHEPSAVVGAHTIILQLGQNYAREHPGNYVAAGKAAGNRKGKRKT